MPIKVGFSTSVCPDWDIHKIAEKASELGYYGVELATVKDEVHLPAAEDLQDDKDVDALRKLFEANSVEIVSIASKYSLEARAKNIADRSFLRNVENIELAGKLGCPFVRVPLDRRVGGEPSDATLARQVPRLVELARVAARNRVTLLACNTAGFPSSRAVWFIVDGVSHPGLRCSWDPVLGLTARESASLAVPRLGARIKMIQVNDAEFDEAGYFAGFRPIGQGGVDYRLMVDLLKGVLFDGYLMLDWPKAAHSDLPEPGDALPEVLPMLLEWIKHVAPSLTAYKKDPNAPNWERARPSFIERKKAGAGADDSQAADAATAAVPDEATKPRVPKGGDPAIAAKVAEAVRKARAARAAKEGK